MQVLVLLGPNLNLLGHISRGSAERLTLSRLQVALRKACSSRDVKIRLLQTDDEVRACRVVKSQRKRSAGVLLVPGLWAGTGAQLRETLEILNLPLAVYHLTPPQGPWQRAEESLFSQIAVVEASGPGLEGLLALVSRFLDQLPPDQPSRSARTRPPHPQ